MIINLYGFFIALGILAGTLVVKKINNKFSTLNFEFSIFDILPYILIPGIIGARIYHLIDYWKYYAENPRQIFLVWQGGLGIFGGLIGGCLGLITYSTIASWRELKKQDIKILEIKILRAFKFSIPLISQFLNFSISNFLNLADLGAIGLSIGQAIGRWGNYFNQELYGLPTNFFLGIYIRPENRLAGYEGFSHFHPLFLYESIGCLIIFIILITVYSLLFTRKKVGLTFFLYLFLYSLLRFWLEFLRIEGWALRAPLSVNYVRVNQVVSLGLMLISGLAIYKKGGRIKS